MNIIIPLGGKGERFSKNGYSKPKPLIKILDKCMIEYVLDNLTISTSDKFFIIYNKNLDFYDFSTYILQKYPYVNLIKIDNTKGAAETLFLGIKYILSNFSYNKQTLVLDCDTFYTQDIVNIFKNSQKNIVFYTKKYNEAPLYSYIKLDSQNIITDIKEKFKISNNANTGAYGFNDINNLFEYSCYIVENNITINNEPYTSCIIESMILSNIKFEGYELEDKYVFSLGTPNDLDKYIVNTYAFLFDLDGTLVKTDNIYFEVWRELLIYYKIILTHEIYEKYIQGNNDEFILNTFLSNFHINKIEFSNLKDKLFIEKIESIQIISGVYKFIEQVKMFGHKCCVVTNCNKNAAIEILKYINLEKIFDFIITANDCVKGKPDIEPYKKAICNYNIENKKCIVFEDSKTGILSGKGIHPKILVGIETNYTEEELINYGADLTIKNFDNLSITNLLNNQDSQSNIINLIKNSSNITNIQSIKIHNNKLKGGFISDVISFKITTDDLKIYNQIFKYESFNNNNLSYMAKKLELYKREYYFYTNISSDINVNIPKFYNLVYDDNNNIIGIVLENLLDKNYKLNLNLNKEPFDITLKIVDKMAFMHSKFWNKNLKGIYPELKDNLDKTFCPFFQDFINEKYDHFKKIWFNVLNKKQIEKCNEIFTSFKNIQQHLSQGHNLTFIHGDIKSPNIFYDINNDYEPCFIDWQHCAIGKGVQDLVFFIIESFDIKNIRQTFLLTKNYYYTKLLEYNIINYSVEDYETDIYNAICYIPFFTSIWFGTIPQDELIDKEFPYNFITKMFYLLENVSN